MLKKVYIHISLASVLYIYFKLHLNWIIFYLINGDWLHDGLKTLWDALSFFGLISGIECLCESSKTVSLTPHCVSLHAISFICQLQLSLQ